MARVSLVGHGLHGCPLLTGEDGRFPGELASVCHTARLGIGIAGEYGRAHDVGAVAQLLQPGLPAARVDGDVGASHGAAAAALRHLDALPILLADPGRLGAVHLNRGGGRGRFLRIRRPLRGLPASNLKQYQQDPEADGPPSGGKNGHDLHS